VYYQFRFVFLGADDITIKMVGDPKAIMPNSLMEVTVTFMPCPGKVLHPSCELVGIYQVLSLMIVVNTMIFIFIF